MPGLASLFGQLFSRRGGQVTAYRAPEFQTHKERSKAKARRQMQKASRRRNRAA